MTATTSTEPTVSAIAKTVIAQDVSVAEAHRLIVDGKPTFPAPTNVALPWWASAEDDEGWEWEGASLWGRNVSKAFPFPNGLIEYVVRQYADKNGFTEQTSGVVMFDGLSAAMTAADMFEFSSAARAAAVFIERVKLGPDGHGERAPAWDAAEQHPKPAEDKGAPKWATEVEPWKKDGPGWSRTVERPFGIDGGGVSFRIAQSQSSRPSGTVKDHPVEIQFEIYALDGPLDEVIGEAREVGNYLLDAADILQGPPPADNSSTARPPRTQKDVMEAVRRILAQRPIKQNDLAIAIGYGPEELSNLNVGRRLLDMVDVERIARGLGVTVWDIFEEAAR